MRKLPRGVLGSGDAGHKAGRLSIGGHDHDAVGLQGSNLGSAPLRILVSAAHAGNYSEIAALGMGLGMGLLESRKEVADRVRMDTIAENNIQQQHSCCRILRCLTHPRTPQAPI
jgi:hypothetical protein